MQIFQLKGWGVLAKEILGESMRVQMSGCCHGSSTMFSESAALSPPPPNLFSFQLPGDKPDGRGPQQHREIPEAVRRARAVPNLPAATRAEGSSHALSCHANMAETPFTMLARSSQQLHSFI